MRTPDQISVIVPTYNRAPLLREALSSVFAQTALVREVVVVDDGSTDDTSTVVQEFDSLDTPLQYLRVEHTNSLGLVRNTGIQRATGSIIALLDSDDIWRPERVERQLARWNNSPNSSFSFCNVRRFNAQGPFAETSWLDPRDDYTGRIVRQLLLEPVALPSAQMFDRAVYDAVGSYSARPVNEDFEWLLEVASRYEGSYTPEPLVMMRAHEGSRSRDRSLQAHIEYLSIVRHFLKAHPELTTREVMAARRGLGNVHLKVGQHYLGVGQVERAMSEARRAIRLSPSDRRGYALLASALWSRVRAQEKRAAQ